MPGVAATRDGHNVSSWAAVSSPRPRNDGLPGNEPTTISSGAPPTVDASARMSRSWSWSYRSCSNHNTTCRLSRSAAMRVRSRRCSADPIACALPPAQPDRNAARVRSSSGRAPARQRALVQHVLPGQHRTAQRRLTRRVPRRLSPLVTMQQRWAPVLHGLRPGLQRASAMIADRRRAPGDPGEFLAHAPQPGDPRVDLVDLRRRPHPQSFGGQAPPAAPHDSEVVLDLGQAEPGRLRLLDRAQEPHRVVVVAAVPARRPRQAGPAGRGARSSAASRRGRPPAVPPPPALTSAP